MALISTATAVPASAAKPVVVENFREHNEGSIPADENPCGIDLDFISDVSVRITDFFDRDGNFIRGTIHVRGTDRTISAHGELVDRWTWNGTFDPETLTETQTGNVWNLHDGNGGPVLVNDSGRIVIDVTNGEALVINGPHDAWFGDFDGVCEILLP